MQLVEFGTSAQAVESRNPKTGTMSVRLMTASEYKVKHGLKGQEGKRRYNEYLRTQGKANTAGLAAAMTSGELLVKGFQRSKNGMRVGFVFAGSIKDPKAKGEKPVTQESALAALGLTAEDLALIASLKDGQGA